jgi:hypothetical protein
LGVEVVKFIKSKAANNAMQVTTKKATAIARYCGLRSLSPNVSGFDGTGSALRGRLFLVFRFVRALRRLRIKQIFHRCAPAFYQVLFA